MPDNNPNYVLGHSEQELERLGVQARLFEPITRGSFQEAGIVPGMRVLDVGSGAGDVAFLAADLVGESGEVVGADRSPVALAQARKRVEARSLHNVSFQEGELNALKFDRPFDAIVGRYVLQFQQDPAALLHMLSAHVRPGGVIVFHEADWDGARSRPPAPTYDNACRWFTEVLRRTNTATHMGANLHATFVAAGLPAPTMRLQAIVGGGANAADALNRVADLVSSVMSEIERLGIATAVEIGIDTLAQRMIDEATANNCTIIGVSEIAAWSRRP